PRRVRGDAHAHDDQVGFNGGPVVQQHPFDAVHPVEAGDAGTETEVDAVVVVQRRARGTHLLTQGFGEGRGQRLEHGDRRARGVAGGGDLRTDEAGTDDDRPPASGYDAVQVGADGETVVDRAEEMNALEGWNARQLAR